MEFLPLLLQAALVACVIYVVYVIVYLPSGPQDMVPSLTPLNTKTDVMMPDVTQKKILGSSGSSVMGFFYLKGGDRTARYGQKYVPLIQVENNWFLESMGGSHEKNQRTTRLRVKTTKGSVKEEIIDLPPIPMQKWVFIAILREGRRFDVIYDSRIVASQRLENYPVIISSPLSVGHKGLGGSAIHVIVQEKRMTPTDVEKIHLTYVDSNHNILETNSIDMVLPFPKLSAQCPPGLPCRALTSPPQNGMQQWKTPYA
jgi:hypothetical protein